MRRLLWVLASVGLGCVAPACLTDDDTFVCPDGDETCRAAFLCGNHELDPGESCDSADEYCSEDCKESLGRCGDGIVQTTFDESCDPGGAAGAAGSSSIPGCADDCTAENGYVCDSDANTCGQTGLDADEIAADHPAQMCRWIVGLLGGPYRGTYCQAEEKVYEFVAPSYETCEENLDLDDECTVGEFESWAREMSRCEIYFEESPCDR